MKPTHEIIDELLRVRSETPTVEVKQAVGGMPRSILETLSAFSNDRGGTILLGLTDPADGLQPAQGFSPESIRATVEDAVREKIVPAINADIYVDSLVNGARILRIDVPEGDYRQKPFYVKSKNLYGGSYTRPGEGERLLTPYEIDRLRENRGQPVFDQEAVLSASEDDLDQDLVHNYVKNLRERQPRAFGQLTTQEVLLRSRVLVRGQGSERIVPTLAGLLALGTYPQFFFPQLEVSVVVLPTSIMGEANEEGARFLDNQTCSGPIPYIIEDATRVLIRNMRSRSVIDGVGRVNRYDYPVEVIRELLANALMHRDYSPDARGSQVQVELYPDRLVVRSPGGIYGAVTPDSLGDVSVSSSRNALLARILSDLPLPGAGHMVAENRGSGIPSVYRALRNSGMELPRFRNRLTDLEVTVERGVHAGIVQDKETVASPVLVAESLEGERKPRAISLKQENRLRTVRDVLADVDSASAQEIADFLVARGIKVSRPTVQRDIEQLISQGVIEATAPPRSKKRRYRLNS